MNERIVNVCQNAAHRQKVLNDYTYTFERIGLNNAGAEVLTAEILSMLGSGGDLMTKEKKIHTHLKSKRVEIANQRVEIGFLDAVVRTRSDRSSIILSQIKDYLSDIKGEIIDFGAGDGRLAQKIVDELGKQVRGVEVAKYKPIAGQTVNVSLFNGRNVEATAGEFEASVCINVLHHDPDSDKILDELARIVSNRLIIIETVPEGKTLDEIEKDKERVFMNDYLSNRIIHGALCEADIPVPGSYDTHEGWAKRLKARGFSVIRSLDLGYDQSTIRDKHHLIVAEKTLI